MTAQNHRSNTTGVWGFPNLRSRQNAANYFSEKNIFGEAGKQVRSVFCRQGRRLCPILERSENSVLPVTLVHAKQVLGKRYPFRTKWVLKAEKFGLPQKNRTWLKRKRIEV
ncbi:MAG: hypothetical protein IJL32_12110 [Oscillospiraceae bacterium]|nr:hypothetical protein [Oscillospiraceae bacterium]